MSAARASTSCAAALAAGVFASAAIAGPVEVYRTGPEFCPHDRAADATVLTRAEAIDRARSLLPRGFCGPAWFVAGCDVETEFIEGSWRIYLHQYQLRRGHRDWGGLTHTYVILDPVGNCLANIPGTEIGAPN